MLDALKAMGLTPPPSERRAESAVGVARVVGAVITLVIGPFIPTLGFPALAGLAAYLLIAAAYIGWLSKRARSYSEEARIAIISHGVDAGAVLLALWVASADPSWDVIIAVQLYIVVGAIRFGIAGAASAAAILAAGTVVVALFREAAFGYAFQPARVALYGAIYFMTASFMAVVVRQLHHLAERRAEEAGAHAALLGAQSDLGEGVLVHEGRGLVRVNDAFLRLAGYRRDDLERLRLPEELFGGEDVAKRLVTAGRGGAAIELALRTRDRGLVPVRVATRAYAAAGRIRGVVVVREVPIPV